MQEAEAGIPWLIGDSSRLTVRVMAGIYGGILGAIERQGFDVFRAGPGSRPLASSRPSPPARLETSLDAWRRFWA